MKAAVIIPSDEYIRKENETLITKGMDTRIYL